MSTGQRYTAAEILQAFPPIGEQRVDVLEDTSSQNFQEGHRNTHLTSLAGTMRRAGLKVDAIDAALQKENQSQCEPPLDKKEVNGIAQSVSRYPPEEEQALPAATQATNLVDLAQN